MPHSPEAHGLGPHVVGLRVVVRRVLPGETGPTGGPAMTDLLGVCTGWGPTTCVVQPESGAAVEIALADIVSGKPVPPRPSARHRVSAVEAQRRALVLWPDLHTEPLGEWLLRRSATETARRANSVLAFEPSGVADDYDRVVAFYQRPIAAVLPDSPEDALFRDRGWVAESHDADTLFQLAGVAQVRRALGSGPSGPAVAEAVVRVQDGLAVARIDDVASGIAAYDRDWVGFRSIEVSPGHRRRGLGLAVMAALLEWGAERGATTAYLQVLGDNTAALALYERLGFGTHHAYRYLTPG
ncbi:MAG: GCN5-related N-acetyltransferase [Nocardioides sp.]|nr:GCN5-related N-acetyltransferase [Nocardioides sp.]